MNKYIISLRKHRHILLPMALSSVMVGATILGSLFFIQRQQTSSQSQAAQLSEEVLRSQRSVTDQQQVIASMETELATLKSVDQYQRNEALQKEITEIEQVYQQSVSVYEDLVKLREQIDKTQDYEASYSAIVTALADRNYLLASGGLKALQLQIDAQQAALAAQPVSTPPTNVPVSNTPPSAGHQRQTVQTEVGSFVVDIISADLNSSRVQAETASEGDCKDNCPVDSLASYVSRAGGFAGINGPYFCPAEYPSCAGKTNSFDTLIMNSKKVYFNSDNNVYSTVPAIIFSGNSARVVRATQEWGRDTSVDAVIAAQPLLLMDGQITFGGDGDPKKGSRGSRSFIGVNGNTVYIGVVRNATVAEVAYVLKSLGLQHGLNLDSGGSTALINGGRYLAGPGRNTPFGIVLVRK